MLAIANTDGKPVDYRNFIRNHFTVREVLVSPVALTENHDPSLWLEADVQDPPDAVQDRSACCGTMNLAEYFNVEDILDTELQALSNWCAQYGCVDGKHTNGASQPTSKENGASKP